MLDQLIAITSKLCLWQISIIVGIVLLTLGFTGEIPYTEIDLRAGRSVMAIKAGVFFFVIGVTVKLLLTFTDRDQ